MEREKHRIITISREFGSGGRTIGKDVAEALGIPCYDSELIEKIAEESGLAKEFIAEKGEYSATGNWFLNALSYSGGMGGMSMQDYLWNVQKKVIEDLADRGPCVIVGRCADFILAGKHDLLKVFIHADLKKRAERIVHVYGDREESPEKRLVSKDKRRKSYYKFYTDIDWGVAEHYDICLDSGSLGIDKCVEIIKSLY
ncbi:MAG: cytidylate kinase-like family protein [Clostridia bacterium]|nr:cytidylate kinase-like family protein [Clostridia bacterium]